MSGIDRLITDALYMFRTFDWAKPGIGSFYRYDNGPVCCLVGGAMMLSGCQKSELIDANLDEGCTLISKAAKKYGIGEEDVWGIIEGFDSHNTVFVEPSEPSFQVGFNAGREARLQLNF